MSLLPNTPIIHCRRDTTHHRGGCAATVKIPDKRITIQQSMQISISGMLPTDVPPVRIWFWRSRALQILALGALCWAAYASCLDNGFISDDYVNLRHGETLQFDAWS